MPPTVIVLNGGSSAGKTSIARRLQDVADQTWLTFGIDDLVRALPGGDRPPGAQRTIDFAPDGSIEVSAEFHRIEEAWYRALALLVRTGSRLILDQVLLGGRAGQERMEAALGLDGVQILWVGVRCAPDVAEARERGRTDRVVGMARRQADAVHDGVRYDLVVDTTDASPEACAQAIAARLG